MPSFFVYPFFMLIIWNGWCTILIVVRSLLCIFSVWLRDTDVDSSFSRKTCKDALRDKVRDKSYREKNQQQHISTSDSIVVSFIPKIHRYTLIYGEPAYHRNHFCSVDESVISSSINVTFNSDKCEWVHGNRNKRSLQHSDCIRAFRQRGFLMDWTYVVFVWIDNVK